MISVKTLLKIFINSVIGVGLIILWLQFVNINEIWHELSTVSLISLLPIFFFLFLSSAIRALRLKFFLAEIKKISLKDLVMLNGVSQMLNFFIPIRAGEVAKGVYLNTRYGLPMGKSIIWVFIDRFLDFLAILLVASLLVMVVPSNLPTGFAKTAILIFVSAGILTYLAIYQSHAASRIVKFLSHLLIEKHIKIYFERFTGYILDSFSVLRRKPLDLALLMLLTIMAYAADAAIWYFGFVALGVNEDFMKMYLGQLISALLYLIPAAPGYVGSAEASGLLILSGFFGIEKTLASSMIVLFHLSAALFVLGFGLIGVSFLKLDLGMILKKALKKE